jgi:hypothetical protein
MSGESSRLELNPRSSADQASALAIAQSRSSFSQSSFNAFLDTENYGLPYSQKREI